MPLGKCFDPFGRLVRAKLVPKSSSNHLLVERVVVHETICFPTVVDAFSLDMALPKRPKMAPRRLRDRLGRFVLRLPFSLRFGTVLGFVLVPLWMPKWTRGDRVELGVSDLLGVQDPSAAARLFRPTIGARFTSARFNALDAYSHARVKRTVGRELQTS